MFWLIWFGCPGIRRRASRAVLKLALVWIVFCGFLYVGFLGNAKHEQQAVRHHVVRTVR